MAWASLPQGSQAHFEELALQWAQVRVKRCRGVRKQATAYLNFLYTPAGQEIGAKHFLRVRNEAVMKKFAGNYKPVSLFSVDELFGGWRTAQKVHFDDGGEFDKIYTAK